MDKKTVILKGATELHIKDVGEFFIRDKKAYYADGRPVEPGKLFVCQHCTNSPPLVTPKEIDFVKHMIDKHPEHATKEVKKAEEKIVKKVAKKTAGKSKP